LAEIIFLWTLSIVFFFFNETPRFGSRLCFRLQTRETPNLLNPVYRAVLGHWANWSTVFWKLAVLLAWGKEST